MSPNPLAMAPTNVQTTAVQQGSPVGNGIANQHRNKQKVTHGGSSPRHRKNKNTRERNTPSPKQLQQQQRGSPKLKTTAVSSRRNYTPPPRFQKISGQFDGAMPIDIPVSCNTNTNNNFPSISNFSVESGNSSSDDSESGSKKPFAGAKFHSKAPSPECLPMPPSTWLAGRPKAAPTVIATTSQNKNEYQQLANELKCMLKVTL